MIKEMGEIAGRSPGVHWDMPSLFSQGGFSATSDAKASVKYAKYTAASPDGATGPSLEINDASFGQDVTTPLKEIPAVLDKLPAILKTRVELAHEIAVAVPNAIEAVADAISPIAAGAHALRDIFKNRGQPVPEGVAAILERIDALEAAAKDQ